jgi:PKHD-type hydroxylase
MQPNLWWVWENVIPHDKCDEILAKHYQEDKSEDAGVGVDEGVRQTDESIRKTRVCWDKDQQSELRQLMFDFALAANRFAGWRLQLERVEDVQLAKYEDNGFYNFHNDSNFGTVDEFGFQRKITVILQLSDESEYEGGNFSFFTGREIFMPRSKGSIIAFPCLLLHRVSPVSNGTRFSATAWAGGAPFR